MVRTGRLQRASIEELVGSANNAAKVHESLFIDLILGEKLLIVTEIPQEPIELPEGAFGRVKSAGEGAALERLRF